MVRAFDVAAALSGGVNKSADAWHFITSFAQQWTTPLTANDGFTREEVAEAEARLGTRLPRVIREAHMLFGRRAYALWQDPFLSPESMYFEDHDGDRFLIIHHESQGCWAWGIAADDLSLDDPPVRLHYDHQAVPGMAPLFPRASLAFVQATLSDQVMRQQYDLKDDGWKRTRTQPLSPGLLTAVKATFPDVSLPSAAWSRDPGHSEIRWHASPGCLIEVTSGLVHSEAVLITQSEDALQHVLSVLPGPWSSPPEPTSHRQPAELPSGIDDPWGIAGGHFST